MIKTLKDIIKPPFEIGSGMGVYERVIYSDDQQLLRVIRYLKGGPIKTEEDAELVFQFLFDAFKEKWERDFGG